MKAAVLPKEEEAAEAHADQWTVDQLIEDDLFDDHHHRGRCSQNGSKPPIKQVDRHSKKAKQTNLEAKVGYVKLTPFLRKNPLGQFWQKGSREGGGKRGKDKPSLRLDSTDRLGKVSKSWRQVIGKYNRNCGNLNENERLPVPANGGQYRSGSGSP